MVLGLLLFALRAGVKPSAAGADLYRVLHWQWRLEADWQQQQQRHRVGDCERDSPGLPHLPHLHLHLHLRRLLLLLYFRCEFAVSC